ncbi:MAG: hypothetical protein WB624_26505 [Xanthobacteraceae bacterium]|jgi:hypothetical protein
MDALVDHLIQILTREWAVVMAHREAFLAILGAGLFFGWVAAWLILRQRLSHHKELVDHYKEVIAGNIPVMTRPKALSLGRMLMGVAILLIVTIGPLYVLLVRYQIAAVPNTEGARFVLNPGPLNRETKTVDINAINMGDTIARVSTNGANEVVYSNRVLTEKEEDEWYEKVKAILPPVGTGIDFLKGGGRSMSVDLKLSDKQLDDMLANKTYVYLFFLIAFKDETTPTGKYFVASLCVHYQGSLSTSKICFGHNESRLPD